MEPKFDPSELGEHGIRRGLERIGPHTAVVLLELWGAGQISLNLREYRHCVKTVSGFLEYLEEVRGNVILNR